MKYQYRPGIVRVRICGEYLLVPTREASEACPEIIRLPLLSAAVLEEIEKGRDLSIVSSSFQKLTGRSAEDIDSRIRSILENLCERGYLVQVGDDT